MNLIKRIRILFTRKGLMTSKKSQFYFNQMFKPYSKKEMKELKKRLDL